MPAGRLASIVVLTAVCAAGGSRLDALPPAARPAAHEGAAPTVRPLPFLYDLHTFRGRSGRTAIVASFAVEAGHLEVERFERASRYRFEVTLILVDTLRRTVSRTADSVYVEVPHTLPDYHLLYTHIEVDAPPSGSTWHRVIMTDATTPGIGQLYRDYFPIPDYSGGRLMLSDIALGNPNSVSGWTRGDVTIALLPSAKLPASAFDVYYEIYNLPAGHQYTTEIRVEPTDTKERDPRPTRLSFTNESAAGRDGSLAELRRIETMLPRGSYRLTIDITDRVTGQTVSRSRTFEVQGWERGATMVAAMPHRAVDGGLDR